MFIYIYIYNMNYQKFHIVYYINFILIGQNTATLYSGTKNKGLSLKAPPLFPQNKLRWAKCKQHRPIAVKAQVNLWLVKKMGH